MPTPASTTTMPANASLRWRSVRSIARPLHRSGPAHASRRARPPATSAAAGRSLLGLLPIGRAVHRAQPERDRRAIVADRPAPQRRWSGGPVANGLRSRALLRHAGRRIARTALHRSAVGAAGAAGSGRPRARARATVGSAGTARAGVRTAGAAAEPAAPARSGGCPAAGAGACAAGHQTTGSWSGGFQAQITVTAGATAINGFRGFRTAEQGAAVAVAFAVLDDSGPTGTFATDTGPLPW